MTVLESLPTDLGACSLALNNTARDTPNTRTHSPGIGFTTLRSKRMSEMTSIARGTVYSRSSARRSGASSHVVRLANAPAIPYTALWSQSTSLLCRSIRAM